LYHHVINIDPDWTSPIVLISTVKLVLKAKATETIRAPQFLGIPYQIQHGFKMRMLWTHRLGEEGKETDIAFVAALPNMAVIYNCCMALCSLGLGPVNAVNTANNVHLMPREQSLVFFPAKKG